MKRQIHLYKEVKHDGNPIGDFPQRGTILAVGPGRLLDSGERAPLSIGVGDEILFGKYGGTDIEVDGEEVKILRESDILAKVL